MYKYRFFIEKISVQGIGKTNAELIFDKGVNIISGSSDTGKSYIFKCIDYVLGAETLPKEIPESKGYTEVFLQLKTPDGRVFTLHRNLREISNVLLSESKIENYLASKKVSLGGRNNSKNGENVSEFLLNLIDVNNVYLKTNANNKTKKLSFRHIAQLTLIDESRIITEGSPIYSSPTDYYAHTFEKSVFKYLLTGDTDNDLIEVEEPKLYQSRVKGKIDLINSLLDIKNESAVALSDEMSDFSSSDVQMRLDDLLIRLNESSTKLNELTFLRKNKFDELTTVQSDNLRYSELNKRFKLLEEHYNNDLKRLEFILQGDHVFSQLISTSCPICGNKIDDKHIACLTEEKKISVAYSVEIERKKVSMKLSDLKKTILTTEMSILNNSSRIEGLQQFIDGLNEELQNKLLPLQNQFQEEINLIYGLREKESRLSNLIEEIESLSNRKKDFEIDLLSKNSSNSISRIDLGREALKLFTTTIEKILRKWNYENVISITLDESHKVYDIIISGRARNSHGKGVRAVVYSAFILGLLDYCIVQNRKHTGVVVLDSPLTTYHSTQAREEGDEVSKNLEIGFFEYLASLGDDRQVIIFDNKSPDKSILKNFNYVEFSKFDNSLRKGFFQ